MWGNNRKSCFSYILSLISLKSVIFLNVIIAVLNDNNQKLAASLVLPIL